MNITQCYAAFRPVTSAELFEELLSLPIDMHPWRDNPLPRTNYPFQNVLQRCFGELERSIFEIMKALVLSTGETDCSNCPDRSCEMKAAVVYVA
jgi:hypothetical protein